jgi:hypothetical protein
MRLTKKDQASSKDTVIVYWSVPNYIPAQESWSMLYSEPESVATEVRKDKSKDSGARSIHGCPAAKDTFTNLFTVKSQIDNTIEFSDELLRSVEKELQDAYNNSQRDGLALHTNSKVLLWAVRPSSFKDNANILLNMGWLFFADEPLTAEFTAPYYPATSPASNVRLSPGRFDIGQWFRPYHLDYHVPFTTKTLTFKKNDDLFYIKLHTEKKVVFKRFVMTVELENLHKEFVESPNRYSTFFAPLEEKYKIAKNTKMTEQVLHHIRKNCVE